MTRGPVHIAEPLVNVLQGIESAFWARREGHSMPVVVEPGEDEETEPAPCRRRSRDPPTGALRVKGEIFGIDEKKGEMTEWLSKCRNTFNCGGN